MTAADRRTDGAHARDLRPGGRGLSRARPAGRVARRWPGPISLSPASIRGVMQELEERGLLTHPHTSAGRIPTETGLRLFVDGIMQAAAARPARAARDRTADRSRPADRGCARSRVGGAVRAVSQAAGVVLAPKRELRLRQLNFVPLSSRRALAVLVGSGRQRREPRRHA